MGRRKKKTAAALTALLITAGFVVWFLAGRSEAVFREEDAVHIDPDKIEQSTLIVGTHLIYLGSITDKLYETAAASAEESGQTDIYYRSELGDGRWYAVNDAGSLKDISEKGKEISKSRIKSLFLTHHTKSDGYTYRLKDNKRVSVYEINSPYDLEGMKELSALSRQKELNGKGAEVFQAKVKNKVTKWCDKSLDKLNKESVRLRTAGADAEWLDMLDKAMGKVDDLRRHEVYKKVNEKVQKLLDDEDGADAGYNEALSGTLTELSDRLAETDGNLLNIDPKQIGEEEESGDEPEEEEPDNEPEEEEEFEITVMAEMESELIWQYIQDPDDRILTDMVTLQHIMDGVSTVPGEEAEFLKNKLIPAAEAAYARNPTEAAGNELEYYRSEWNLRENGTEESGQELRQMYDEKAELEEKRLAALDEEDLTEAKRIEALIDVKSKEIKDREDAVSRETASLIKQKTGLEEELSGPGTEEEKEKIQNEIGKLDSRITALGAGVDESAATARIQKMAEEAAEAMEEGADGAARAAEAVDGIEALCGSNPELAGSSLRNLYEKMAAKKYLDDTKIYDSILDSIEAALAENMTVLDGETDEQEAVQIMEETAGKDKTAALMGLSMLVEQTADAGLENLLEGKAKAWAGEEDAYVFARLSGTAGIRYAPADVTARYASVRYVFNDNKKRATLASRKTYYQFTAFQSSVIRGPEEQKEKLSSAAGFKGTVYIPEDYVKREFGCEVYDIPGTGYCILIDQDITDKAAEVCDALLEKGE